jgi:hypothetical protein
VPEGKGGNMPLVWGITRIIPFVKENAAIDKQALLIFEFMTAYTQLRKDVPKGDLRIHLSVEGGIEELGIDASKLEPPRERNK